ncbi:MAG: GAF domain-containing protein [Chloroflexi bacterium]|nr:GAF domain-containing protein [Chloroflexota bacterium]
MAKKTDAAAEPREQKPALRQRLEKQERQSAALNEAVLSLVSELSLQPLLEKIVQSACRLTSARYGALAVLGPEGRIQEFITHGVTPEQRQAIGALPQGKGLLGLIIQEKRTLRVADIAAHPNAAGFPPRHPHMRSFLGAPIVSHEETFGDLYLAEKEGAPEFDEEDERLVESLAAVAAAAIGNARHLQATEQKTLEVEALNRIGRALVSSLDAPEVLDTIVRAAATLLEADKAHLFIVDRERRSLHLGALYRYSPQTRALGEVLIGQTVIGRVVETGESLVVQDTSRELRPLLGIVRSEGIRSFIHIPIRVAGEIYGVFGVDYLRPNAVPQGARPVLEALADQAAIAIRNAQLFGEIAQERNALSAVFQSVSAGVFTVGKEMAIELANDRIASFLGLSPSALRGHPSTEAIPLQDGLGRPLPPERTPMHRAIQTGEVVPPIEVFLPMKGDRRLPVDVSAAPIRDRDRRVVGAVVVVQDVSHRHAVEELRQSITSLVSHELRTPLGHIKGFATSLLQQDVTWDAATQREFLEGIVQETDRMARLVSDLLDLSRIESGQHIAQNVTAVEPRDLLESGARASEPFLRDHSVALRVPPGLPPVLVDANQVLHVTSNLLENAAKYSPPGTQITLAAQRRERDVLFSVTDQGPGIPEDKREAVFERFVRLPMPDGRPRPPGTGLGLTLCKAVVEAHGGRIWIEQGPAGGARILFTLPRAPASHRQNRRVPRPRGGP